MLYHGTHYSHLSALGLGDSREDGSGVPASNGGVYDGVVDVVLEGRVCVRKASSMQIIKALLRGGTARARAKAARASVAANEGRQCTG